MSGLLCIVLTVLLDLVQANPIILKGSPSNGRTVIAISSSSPEMGRHLSFKNLAGTSSDILVTTKPEENFARSFTFATPGAAAAGTGRSFVSTSSFNPFLFPLFHFPINIEGYGLSNFGINNFLKGFENFYDPTFLGNGNGQTVTAVNDNGHVYGKINSVSFDNRANGPK